MEKQEMLAGEERFPDFSTPAYKRRGVYLRDIDGSEEEEEDEEDDFSDENPLGGVIDRYDIAREMDIISRLNWRGRINK